MSSDLEMTKAEEDRWNNILTLLKVLSDDRIFTSDKERIATLDRFDTQLSSLSDDVLETLAKRLEPAE